MGAFGRVLLCRHLVTMNYYAIKVLDKDKVRGHVHTLNYIYQLNKLWLLSLQVSLFGAIPHPPCCHGYCRDAVSWCRLDASVL